MSRDAALLLASLPLIVVGLLVLALAAMVVSHLVQQARCNHDDVKLRKQCVGGHEYFAEVCMDCSKAWKVRQ